jgi:hypothetical protein
MNGSRPLLAGSDGGNANREIVGPREIATTAHPLFCSLVRQTLLLAGGVIVFLGGVVLGNLLTAAWGGPGNWFGSEKPLQAAVLDKLKNELRLTPVQTARIGPIIAVSCADLRLVSEQSRARRLEVLDEIGATIGPELNDDQRRRLEDLEAEWQKRPQAKRDERIVALF